MPNPDRPNRPTTPPERDPALREQLDALREEVEFALRKQRESAEADTESVPSEQQLQNLSERLQSALRREFGSEQRVGAPSPKPRAEAPSTRDTIPAFQERKTERREPTFESLARTMFLRERESFAIEAGSRHTRFNFNESKTVEALVFLASRWPGITPFFVAKVLFFADRDHLRAYGRPVTGDVYIAMADGPVPSHVYDMVKGNLDFFGDPEAVSSAVRVDRNERYPRLYAERDPNLNLLSETDVAALESSIAFCRERSFRDLSNLTHQEVAWIEAAANGEMNPELLVPEEMREEVRESAAYAVL
jgi:uncharacterized phage-associated protein